MHFLLPAAMAGAFCALIGIAHVVKADAPAVQIEAVTVRVVCDRRTIEEHLALIETDPTYKLVQERFLADIGAGKCVQTPPVTLPVLEQGRQVKLVDGDGDLMLLTVVRIMDGAWTLSGRIVGKGS